MTFKIDLTAAPFASNARMWGVNRKGDLHDIEVLNADAVFDAFDAYLAENGIEPYSDEAIAEMRAFCARENIHFYGAPGDEFRWSDGLNAAAQSGCRYLLAEDLS